ncbi:MAG: hypothetical protein A2341_11410 [Deltaproteobacteria bacterium RIFOXYB12_FULL_58_9]|nr:MAG: hypothetical protein A2341_11410 [Deltaproteobacteria bacterium RIFOXYB12_FULL_58_9]
MKMAPVTNIYLATGLRILAVMLLYTLCRVGFLAFNWELFPDTEVAELVAIFLGGLTFDLSAVFYTNLIFVLMNLAPLQVRHHRVYQGVAGTIFFVTNGLGLAANCVDFAYFRFTLHRTTASVLDEFSGQGNMVGLVARFAIDYWYVTLCFAALVVLLAFLYTRVRVSDSPRLLRGPLYYGVSSLILVAGVFFLLVGMRGGFFGKFNRPINPTNAAEYVDKPEHVAAVLNTPFTMIRTIDKEPFPEVEYFSQDELETIYDPVRPRRQPLTERRLNVVVFILESFSREHFGSLNVDLEGGAYEGFTPFLDSLGKESLVFANAYANGHKSIEALPSVTAGIPSLIEPFISSHHYSNRFESLASLLHERGYRSAFFHGAPNGSMGFGAFAKMAGFDSFFGMNEYGNDADYDGYWGIWDEEYFLYLADELNGFEQPFFATVFSLSSHSPSILPERYEGKFRKGSKKILQCVQYTDYAMKQFFAKASQMPWYQDTLFVITADHTAPPYHKAYKSMHGRFSVPIMLFRPGDTKLRGVDEQVAQQIDILPTVMRYLGFDGELFAFGNDLLDPTADRFAVFDRGNQLALVKGDHILLSKGTQISGLYAYREDPRLQHDILAEQPELGDSMERYLQAVVQQYNNRMVRNQIACPCGETDGALAEDN